ncbi:MAG: DUF5658 family protein [Desulfurococcaceae archaeon]
MVSEEALWTFAFLNLADISTTLIALKRGAYEINPVARFFIGKLGLKALFMFKYLAMGLSLLIAFMFGEALAEQLIWIWNIILSCVVAWNSYVNLKLKDKDIKDSKHVTYTG